MAAPFPPPRHDRVVVVRRHEHAPRLGRDARGERRPVVLHPVVEDDLGAVPAGRLHLQRGRVGRHADDGARADHARRQGDALSVVARRVRDDAARAVGVGERAELVERAADLEGSRALEVLALEEHAVAARVVERLRRDGRGAVDPIAEPPRVPLLVRVREELTKAAADPEVRALVVRIDSAGGTVTASDVIYRELVLFKRETGRPVVAVMLDVAASGGYYVALAADTIIAHPTSVTGSIGVLMVTLSAEGLLQKLGLSTTTIKSAERKDMGSPLRALTDEERRIFQSVIDSLYGQFVEKLAESRRLGLETARKVADGRIYTAQQALDLKLIDRIGYMPDAIEAAKRVIGVEEARIVVYRRPREYRATYYARSEAPAAAVESSLARLGAALGAGPRFLYFWWP